MICFVTRYTTKLLRAAAKIVNRGWTTVRIFAKSPQESFQGGPLILARMVDGNPAGLVGQAAALRRKLFEPGSGVFVLKGALRLLALPPVHGTKDIPRTAPTFGREPRRLVPRVARTPHFSIA